MIATSAGTGTCRACSRANYERIAHRIPDDAELSDDRRSLVGAWFTHEYSVEAAALFNPSVVVHPDQTGLEPGRLPVRPEPACRRRGAPVARGVPQRRGLGAAGELRIDEPGRHIESGRTLADVVRPWSFAAALARPGHRSRVRRVRRRPASARFHDDELEAALADLAGERLTRPTAARTTDLARRIAASSYEVEFPPETALAERVLWPQSPSESHGIEDARFVRVEDDGVYRATYTAFDGASIAPQLIETADFRRFRMSQLAGPAAQNKGMALFPGGSGAATSPSPAGTGRTTPSPRPPTGSGGTPPARCRRRAVRGSCCSSGTVVRRSRPRPAGSC